MLEEELGRMNPDMTAIAAFQAKEAEYAQRVTDLEAATAERDRVSSYCCLLLQLPLCRARGFILRAPAMIAVPQQCAATSNWAADTGIHRQL